MMNAFAMFLGALGMALFLFGIRSWSRRTRAERRLRGALDLLARYDGKVPLEEWDRFCEGGDGKD